MLDKYCNEMKNSSMVIELKHTTEINTQQLNKWKTDKLQKHSPLKRVKFLPKQVTNSHKQG